MITSLYAVRRGGMALLCGLWLLVAGITARAQDFDEDHKEKINGTTLHFRVRGTHKNHPYLVILHGGPGFSAHMFLPWGRSLEKTLNVVYLDQRGSGESEHTTFAGPMPTKEEMKGFTVANMAEDIEGVRQFLKVEKWHVLGHSWGGMLGVQYVTAHPDHVLTYIHMDGLLSTPMIVTSILDNAEAKFTAQAKTDDADKKKKAENLLKQVANLRSMPADDMMRLFGAFQIALGPADLYVARTAEYKAYNAKIAEQMAAYKTPMSALYAPAPAYALVLNDHYVTQDITPLLPKITVPTLVINGKQDGVITPKSAELVIDKIRKSRAMMLGDPKNVRLLLLDDCGHFPFAEQPDKTTAALLEFISEDHGFRGSALGKSF